MAVVVLALFLAGCGPDPTLVQAPPAAEVVPVNANTATEDELVAAYRSAGVPNPTKWAEETVEYRPYPEHDIAFTKLRDNLAKYEPGEETLNRIISALHP